MAIRTDSTNRILVQSTATEPGVFAFESTELGQAPTSEQMAAAIRGADEWRARAFLAQVFTHCSELTGGAVVLEPSLRFMPTLLGTDGKPIFLYQFVEALDGMIDYDEMRSEFPLNYGQIHSALAFLRKLVMTNPSGIDIDQLEDDRDLNDAELIEELRRGFNSGGSLRVLGTE